MKKWHNFCLELIVLETVHIQMKRYILTSSSNTLLNCRNSTLDEFDICMTNGLFKTRICVMACIIPIKVHDNFENSAILEKYL